MRAIVGMLWGLNVLWIGGAGLLTPLERDKARDVFRRPPRYFGLKFFLLFTLLALIEEAIATLMTNCAPIIAALLMVALLLLVIAPGHPSIHFPPMGAKSR